jgi:hypothetical protein
MVWAALYVIAARGGRPRVSVIVGAGAPQLERFAASELCTYLNKLYDIKVELSSAASPGSQLIFLVGSPLTNPAISKAAGSNFPGVSEQGIVLRRTSLGKMPALIVGGGSARATMWAVYELVERWGVRYLLHGDVFPSPPGELRLPTADVVMEPKLTVRQWRTVNVFPCGPESWGMHDYKPVLDQLAKLKFNRVYSVIWAHHPFLDYQAGAIKRHSATLFFGQRFPITDDMVGRQLFGDEKEFWNRDLPIGGNYQEITAAGIQLIHNLTAYAHERGMSAVLTTPLTEFPQEFQPLMKGAQQIHQLGELTIVPGSDTPFDDPGLNLLARTVLQATVNTYPETDFLDISMVEHRQWLDLYPQAWKALDERYGIEKVRSLADALAKATTRKASAETPERCVREVKGDIVHLYFVDQLLRQQKVLAGTKRPDMKFMYEAVAEELMPIVPRIVPRGWESLNFVDYTPSRILARQDVLEGMPTREIPTSLIFTLHDDNVGIVPQLEAEPLAKLTALLIKDGWAGYSTRYWLIGDHDPTVAFIAKAAWDANATLEEVERDQIRAASGDNCVDDMLTVFREVGGATVVYEFNDLGLAFPVPEMMTKHWKAGAMPGHLLEARSHYQAALDAARRALAKSRPESRGYAEYWIGRLEFGIGYLNAIEHVKLAATAEANHHRDEAFANGKAALEAARLATESMARVARDRSDVGMIAVLNEFVLRPLVHKVADLQN